MTASLPVTSTARSRLERIVAPARFVAGELLRRAYRRRFLSADLPARRERLRQRLAVELEPSVGPRVSELDRAAEDRISPHRTDGQELCLGEFDQDGGLLPHFGPIAGLPIIAPEQFLPRRKYSVRLMDVGGRLGVRKEYAGREGRFLQELEAALHLSRRRCLVPAVIAVNWDRPAITFEYVPGDVLREMLARAGAKLRDRDVLQGPARSSPRERIRSGREKVPELLSPAQIREIVDGLRSIHAAGYVLEDVKYGNIIIRHGTGSPLFIDFERALPTEGLPRWLADHLRAVDLHKLRDHFGDAPGSAQPESRTSRTTPVGQS
ncbi:MAG: hypothetical protein ABIQ32_07830 [Sphingomicrobium sp.]